MNDWWSCMIGYESVRGSSSSSKLLSFTRELEKWRCGERSLNAVYVPKCALGKGISKIILVVVALATIIRNISICGHFKSGLEENGLYTWTNPSLITVPWECYDLSKQAIWVEFSMIMLWEPELCWMLQNWFSLPFPLRFILGAEHNLNTRIFFLRPVGHNCISLIAPVS
jgi:hypothetical protein